ncbi:MAG: TetR/AcrR family transcriptional regulator [Planctomycetota bacterium]|nr:TetR/AcrR family transcriptional regulator [Planctomycetota bacterium]
MAEISVETTATGRDKSCSSGRRLCHAKRERILEEAARLFSSRDYHQVLMDEIAEAAKVSKGTIYRYFPTKEDLFIAILQMAVERTVTALTAEMAAEDTAEGKLRRVTERAISFFIENDALYKVINHEKVFRYCEQREDLLEVRSRIRKVIESVIAQGINGGEFRSDLDPVFASISLLGMIRSVIRNFRDKRPVGWMAGEILRLFLSGVGVEKSATGAIAGSGSWIAGGARETRLTAMLEPAAD